MSVTAVYWQHGEKIRKQFPSADAAHAHMTTLWVDGECSPAHIITDDGRCEPWRTEPRT